MSSNLPVRPVGYRLLVKPEKIEEKSKSGIVIVTEETKKLEQNSQVRGLVVAVSPLAYAEYVEKGQEPWCKVGDTILYQRHSGMRVPNKVGEAETDAYLLLNDVDVTAVVENG